jgi:hypothetical protein
MGSELGKVEKFNSYGPFKLNLLRGLEWGGLTIQFPSLLRTICKLDSKNLKNSLYRYGTSLSGQTLPLKSLEFSQ